MATQSSRKRVAESESPESKIQKMLRELGELKAKATPGEWTVDRRDWMGRPAQDLYISGDHYRDPDGPCCTGIAIVTCPITGSVVGRANADAITGFVNNSDLLLAMAEEAMAGRALDAIQAHGEEVASLEINEEVSGAELEQAWADFHKEHEEAIAVVKAARTKVDRIVEGMK